MAVALIARILLTVLKAVLILFLAIILFVLLAAGVVLLSPAKYKIRAEKYDVVKVESIVSWLFGIIRVSILYNNGKHSYNIKIFGVNYRNKKKKEQIINTDTDNDSGGIEHEEKTISKDTGKKTSKRKEDKTTYQEDKKSKEVKKDNKSLKQDSGEGNSKKIGSSSKVNKKKPKKKKENSSKREKISKIKEFIFEENTKGIIGVTKDSLWHLLLKIKPHRIKSDILFGMGDACQTGQVLGIIAIYMAMTGMVLNITPDFENRVLRGRLEVSGHIRAVSFLSAVLKVILNRQWKSFYKNAKKIKGEL